MQTTVAVAWPRGRRRALPVVPVVALTSFTLLSVLVVSGLADNLDRAVYEWTLVHRSPHRMRLATAVVYLGEPLLAPFGLLGLAGLLAVRRRCLAPIRPAGLAVALLGVVIGGAKLAFGRVGPGMGTIGPAGGVLPALLDPLHRGAYPSGHTTTAVVTWTVGAWLVAGRRLRRPAMALVALVGVAVGAGLVYAGYHWLSDVLAAYALGIALSWLVTTRSRRRG